MKVFEILPAGFFRILTGKNREIYVEALLALRRSFKQAMHIDRSDLQNQIAATLADIGLVLDIEAEWQELATDSSSIDLTTSSRDAFASDATYNAMASTMLRRLLSTGWIEQEQKPQSFEIQITLPSFTIDMLEFLDQVTRADTQDYKNFAFATYSALRAIQDPESQEYLFTAFSSSYESCQRLMDALKTLLNNIRRYHRILGESVSTNDILRGHFEGYQVLVNERIFHPMVTRDSVLRFRQPVLALLRQIGERDDLLSKMSGQAAADKRFASQEIALETILLQMQEIADVFDGIEAVMHEIQTKNNNYTKASTDKLIYLLNQDRSVKEQLAKIIMGYRHLPDRARQDLLDNISLFRQSAIDGKSLFTRTNRRIRSEEPPLRSEPVAADSVDLHNFLRSTGSRFSHERVLQHMRECFGERLVLHSEEMPVESSEQFVLLLLAALKGGESRMFYTVDFLDGMVETPLYHYPRMRFIKKENNR